MAVLGNLGTMFVRDKNGQMVPVPVIRGEDGGFYTPEIKDGVIRWAASRPDMPEVPDMDIGTGGGGGTPDAVQFVPQELTDKQQAQARENIGAARTYTLRDGETIDDAPEDADIVWDPENEGEGAGDGTGGGTVDLTEVHERIDAIEDEIADLGGTLTEPAEDDIPKVFFGGALQQTKDEAVVPFRYISKTDDFNGYAEIKAQGNSSMNYPKKNQTVKLFKDAECTEKLKVDFKGWGKQNKHVYKANWIDLSHARNVVSARLWGDVVKSRADYAELPELFRTTPNLGAVDGFPVKVYAAGVYQGRYTLNIPKDKWTFNMDDGLDEHCVLCGENYKSGCFRAAAKIDESDWTDEIHDTVPASIKTRWNQVISFVMNSTDDEFKSNLGNYFYVDSLIDYYLFGLVSCGLDAFGKNQIYATYDGQKWIASMYDMDSTWGLYWNGSKFVATNYARTSYEDFVSTASDGSGNLLYIRLEQLFYAELQSRWAELKSGALSIDNIINRFERFTDIAPPELVKEDYASTTGGGKFTGIPSQNTNNIQQIRAYALARQAWTDTYVAGLTGGGTEPDEPDEPTTIPCTGITLDKSALTFTGTDTQTLTATVTPSDTTDKVVWSSDAQSVATVSNGVVTSVGNGSATITATCGNYSASCSVTVSGIVELTRTYTTTTTKVGVLYNDKGTEEANSMYSATEEYLDVEGFAYVTVTGGTSNSVYFAFYDSNKNPISYNTAGISNPGYSPVGHAFMVFNNAKYCRISKTSAVVQELTVKAYKEECMVETPVTWSNTAEYSINSGSVATGGNYITPDAIVIPDGVIAVKFEKVNNSTFTYLGKATYDTSGTFIRYEESPNAAFQYVPVVSKTSVGSVRFSAYPNGTTNIPSTGLAVKFLYM